MVNNKNGSFTVQVTAVNKKYKPSGYQVQFSKVSDFSKIAATKSMTGTKTKITGLSMYGHYYIRARTAKTISGKKQYSHWSGVKEVCILSGVPYYNQKRSFPTGCESVTAVMAMKYLGANISYGKFIDKYLPKGSAPRRIGIKKFRSSNPYARFMGNPRSRSGWGCYPPVIKKAVARSHTGITAKVLHGKSVSSLASNYINKSQPVAIWATVRMVPAGSKKTLITPNGKKSWRSPFHCLLLIGYDTKYFYFNDPISGKNKRYKRSTVQKRYASIGKHAIVFSK